MRILYVLSAVQEPRLGSIRHYHFLKHLSERHSITLLMLAHPELSNDARREFELCSREIVMFSAPPRAERNVSGSVGRLARWIRRRGVLQKMRKRFHELAQDDSHDLVLFHGKGIYPVIDSFRSLPVIADFSGAATMRLRMQLKHSKGAERLWQSVRYLAARRTERRLLGQAAALAFISRRDREAVMGPDSTARVIPNGIDLAFWHRESALPRGSTIIFTGTMSYAPNADAALYLIDAIVPILRRAIPDLKVLIVGRDPTAALVDAGLRAEGVTVTGSVDDVRPYLESAAVFVAPIRYASGLQNKILEAMAMELPVVTTPVVAAALQLDDQSVPPILVAETPEEFAAAVAGVLTDEGKRLRMGPDGRRFVETHFDWHRGAVELDAMCREAVGAGTREAVAA